MSDPDDPLNLGPDIVEEQPTVGEPALVDSGALTPERKKSITFSRDACDIILEELCKGVTLREICERDDVPCYSTVLRWVRDDVGGFAAEYRVADGLKYVAWEDECIAIADDSRNDFIDRLDKNGDLVSVLNAEHIQRSKVRIDIRSRFMKARRPDLYGDRTEVKVTTPGESAEEKEYSMAERARVIKFALAHAEQKRLQQGSSVVRHGSDAADPEESSEELG